MSEKRPTHRKQSPAVVDTDPEQARLDALKELAYGASHEINNPLANISTRAQTLLRMEADPEKRRMLAAIHSQAMRAHEMIADLMLFARPPQLSLTEFDLIELAKRVLEELRPQATGQRTELALLNRGTTLRLTADATQTAVALRAVIQNALEALGSDGKIEVTISKQRGHAIVTIGDDGPGIPAEARPHIFEPFYSGREAGRGLGFGLSKCWRIVTDHGGQIDYIPGRPHGAIFRIRLPLVANAKRAP